MSSIFQRVEAIDGVPCLGHAFRVEHFDVVYDVSAGIGVAVGDNDVVGASAGGEEYGAEEQERTESEREAVLHLSGAVFGSVFKL